MAKTRARASALGKFTRPRPVGALARTRLFRALDRARERPAVWLAGPPGAGKTTLVSTYAAQRRLRTVWYRVHEDDGDPATFFHYFGLAVAAAVPGRRGAALPHLTPEYLPNLGVFTRRYFEQAFRRLQAPCVLVFDNYQEAPQDSALHEVMRELLACLPSGVHVIAVSRSEPPPALALLRARGAIALLGGEELKLTARECGAIARLRKISIEKAALARLHEQTQGWTAGVVLALEQKGPLGAAGVRPEVAPRVMFDYFAGEIFGRMPHEAQALLLQAAFLPSMAAGRAVALTGAPQAERVLADLSRRNYFTFELSQARQGQAVYQFHPLFREFLLARARDTLAPAALDEVQRRAAALLEADGATADAVALLLAAQAWEEAARLVLLHAQEMLAQGRGRVLEAWLRALPTPILERAPWTLYWLGMCRLAFDAVEARAHLERAFALFERDGDSAGVFTAWAAIIDTFVYEWGEFAPVDRWIEVLDRLLARRPRFPTPEIEARVACGMFVALMYRQPQRPDLPRWAQRVRSIVLDAPDARTQMILGNQLLHYYTAWMGDLAGARLLIDAVRRPASADSVGPLAYIAWRAMEAGYHVYRAAHEECLRTVTDGLETVRQTGARFMNSLLLTQGVIGSLTAGDLPAAAGFLEQAAATMAGGRKLDRAHYHFLVSLDAFYRRDPAHALASAREAVALGDAAGVPFCQALYRIGLAHALFASGARREALSYLAQARRIARSRCIENVEFGCLFSAAFFLLERGKQRLALPLLRRTLGVARERGYATRPFWTPEVMTRLFTAALEHGIEVEYVQGLIRRRRLAPPPEALHLERWPFPVRIYTLGRFSVLVDGKPLQFSGKTQQKPLELLMALVAFGGREVAEQRLTDALWPDAEGGAAHAACAIALHRLRKLLGCDRAISLQSNQFSLDPRYVWVDAWGFERGLAQAPGKADAAGRRAAEQAMVLYRGAFLGKLADPTWAMPMRERLRAKFRRRLVQLGSALLETGDVPSALAVFEQGLNADEQSEEAYRHLMLCYRAMNRPAEAIAVYRRCEKTLAATLGVSPAAETVALYRSLRN